MITRLFVLMKKYYKILRQAGKKPVEKRNYKVRQCIYWKITEVWFMEQTELVKLCVPVLMVTL